MPVIKLKTIIRAPVQRCFDLSRSIDLHMISTQHTNETAIAGRTSGLIELGETVTWQARHFGVWQLLTSKIVAMDAPNYFADEMVKGAFKSFRHEHLFEEHNGVTTVTDIFDYTSPLGILGRLADRIFLRQYMQDLLTKRNQTIKFFAESKRWNDVL